MGSIREIFTNSSASLNLPTPAQAFGGGASSSGSNKSGGFLNSVQNRLTSMSSMPVIGKVAGVVNSKISELRGITGLEALSSIPNVGDVDGLMQMQEGLTDEEFKKEMELLLKQRLGKMLVGSKSDYMSVYDLNDIQLLELSIASLVVLRFRKKPTVEVELNPKQEAIDRYNKYNGPMGDLHRYVDLIDTGKLMWDENVEGYIKSIPDEQWEKYMQLTGPHIPGINIDIESSKGFTSGVIEETGNIVLDICKLPALPVQMVDERINAQKEFNKLLEERDINFIDPLTKVVLGNLYDAKQQLDGIINGIDDLDEKWKKADDFTKANMGGKLTTQVGFMLGTMGMAGEAKSAGIVTKEGKMLAREAGEADNVMIAAKEKILKNIEESKKAREASNFHEYVEVEKSIPKGGTKSDFGKYSTAIDGKVTVIEKQELPESLANTFTDGNYRTVVANEDIEVYRDFGFKARSDGAFATTSPAESAIQAKMDSAILPEWKNTLQYEATITIPKGTKLQVGTVEKQITKGGTVLTGGADQILLPQGWDSNWIESVKPLSVGGK